MNKPALLITELFSVRNQYGKKILSQKLSLLNALSKEKITGKKDLQLHYDSLLFLIAYPDNKTIYNLASRLLRQLQSYIQSHEPIKDKLYNSGITNTWLCAAYSFELVKWLRKKYPTSIRLSSFEADEGQIQSTLAVVMRKVESEILLDGNADWRSWLSRSYPPGEDLLDQLIAVFDQADLQPGVRDELWAAIGINVEINFPSHDCLPASLFTPYYHRSLIKKEQLHRQLGIQPLFVNLDEQEAEQIIACGRMILIRHLREIDPITFTAPRFVSFYQLSHGISIALMGMVPERRNPLDSYMGYLVFKNGLPVAYAATWILFDSGRIGLNVFPSYRGGEAQFIFDQVLKLHARVYQLHRFSVDPYQIGKDNSDGIQSGAFWVYYHAGFRPVKKDQQILAEAEASKIRSIKGYRSSATVLKKLADARMEMMLKKSAVQFDATDLSWAYARILKVQYNDNRKQAEESAFSKLVEWLVIKDHQERKLHYILTNWSVLLLSHEKLLRGNKEVKKILKKLFQLKAYGNEKDYIAELQRAIALRKFVENILEKMLGWENT